ncbi:DUF2207 domain-containing protein [Dokdonella sp.]|uniref:DUF2207 domain-containing protein n=1 Tax=Dokdonella sp. TaxID=2291710 RepID=UPI0035296AAD
MIRTLLILLFLLCCLDAYADERILEFHSDIEIARDATMGVTETIRVRAEGNRIRRGIYRDFPTHYRDANGNRVHVLFEPLGVTRDGKPEAWHVESLSNGVRVYFGDANVYLGNGEFTYAFRYRTARQLGFFDKHDELYWNVTGNGWDFIIEKASASVSLPEAVSADRITVEGYTGPQGSKAQNYVASVDAQGRAQIATTQPLAPQNGLTLVVGFPKGVVTVPDFKQSLRWFAADNRREAVLALGLLLLCGFLGLQWWRVGRDPEGGAIIPEYDPPAGLSPGAMRYIRRMGYDNRCFAADIVQLGVLGAVRISKETHSKFVVERSHAGGSGSAMPESTRLLYEGLLGDRSSIEFKQENHDIIGPVRRAHEKLLDSTEAKPNFRRNDGIGCLGGLISIATIVAAFLIDNLGPTPQAIVGAVATFILASILASVIYSRIAARIDGRATGVLSIVGLLFALALTAGAVWFLAHFTSLLFALLVALIAGVQVPFGYLMRAPTPAGRKLLDRIEGLRLYLGVAERDDLVRAKAPPMSVEEYQRLLPYAMALDVEKTWGDHLAAAIGPAAMAAAAGSMAWYAASDASRGFDAGSFGSSLGSSLSSAISSSSTAPGSSSGGGGGGSSGGGGGGGGGGGW